MHHFHRWPKGRTAHRKTVRAEHKSARQQRHRVIAEEIDVGEDMGRAASWVERGLSLGVSLFNTSARDFERAVLAAEQAYQDEIEELVAECRWISFSEQLDELERMVDIGSPSEDPYGDRPYDDEETWP